MRDNFSLKAKNVLAGRVGYLCSNPNCKKPTCGPNLDSHKVVNIGVAAHITAASKGGPRYNPNLNSTQRKSLENGIWLCQNCAKLIDSNENKYSVSVINEWKVKAENFAQSQLNASYNTDYNWKYNLSDQLTTFSRVGFSLPIFLLEEGGELNFESVMKSSRYIFRLISNSYIETSHLTKRDNFSFALSLEVEQVEERYSFVGELITHLTPFAYRFGVFVDLLKRGDFEEFKKLYEQYPEVTIKNKVALGGKFLPYKISRINPAKINIEYTEQNTAFFNGDLTTSDLLLYFSLAVNGNLTVFDDQNERKQTEKNWRLINETIDGFDLSEIWINPEDPEKWDFAKK